MTKHLLFILSLFLLTSCAPEIRNLANLSEIRTEGYEVEDNLTAPIYNKGNALSDFSYDMVWAGELPVMGIYYMYFVQHNKRLYVITNSNRGDEFSLYMIEAHYVLTGQELNSLDKFFSQTNNWKSK